MKFVMQVETVQQYAGWPDSRSRLRSL